MQGKTKLLAGAALAAGLLVGSVVASGVSAQIVPTPGAPGAAFCPDHGSGMMGGGVGPRAGMGAFGPGGMHEAVANALGITRQELWEAQADGESVASIAQERNVDLTAVTDAVLAAHSAQLDAAVQAGTLTQAQADAMTARMKSHIENGFEAQSGVGPHGFGMPGGRGMMGGRRMMGGAG